MTFILRLGFGDKKYYAKDGGYTHDFLEAKCFDSHQAASRAWRINASQKREVGLDEESGYTVDLDTGEIKPVQEVRS